MTVRALGQIEWDTPPPPKAANRRRHDVPSPALVTAAALQRPGVWGSYDARTTGLATRTVTRLREHGLEAVSRRTHVYFRAPEAS